MKNKFILTIKTRLMYICVYIYGIQTNDYKTNDYRTNGYRTNGYTDKWVHGQMGTRTNGYINCKLSYSISC